MIENSRVSSHPVAIGAVIAGLVLVLAITQGDQEALAEFAGEILTEIIFVLLPLSIILTIQYISSVNRSVASVNVPKSDANSIHRASGSPVGVALVIMLVLFLLYYKRSVFGGDDDDDSDD
ncbi:hypothetical protein OROHE_016692 [Orobanche hederae]